MKLLLLLLVTLWSTFALAQSSTFKGDTGRLDGNFLLNECEKTSIGSEFCMPYVTGIADGMSYASSNKAACLDLVVPLQMVPAVVKYLNQHPERLHEYMGRLVVDALSQAFPCKAAPK